MDENSWRCHEKSARELFFSYYARKGFLAKLAESLFQFFIKNTNFSHKKIPYEYI